MKAFLSDRTRGRVSAQPGIVNGRVSEAGGEAVRASFLRHLSDRHESAGHTWFWVTPLRDDEFMGLQRDLVVRDAEILERLAVWFT